MSLIDRLAEQKLLAAIESGDFDHLQGQGKPLVLSDDSAVPEESRAGYRIQKMPVFFRLHWRTGRKLSGLKHYCNTWKQTARKRRC